MKPAKVWIAFLALAAAPGARADCAMPEDYKIAEDAGTVTVCLQTSSGRACPDEGLLRRDTGSNAVVLVSRCDGSGCFVDACVPAGTFQYGLAAPYACQGSACGTFYYGQVTVAGAAPGCVPADPAPAPATSVPWGASDTVCRYRGGAASGCSSSGAVLGLNGLVLAAGALLWRRRSRRA